MTCAPTAAGGSLREVMNRLGHSITVAAVRYQAEAVKTGNGYRVPGVALGVSGLSSSSVDREGALT